MYPSNNNKSKRLEIKILNYILKANMKKNLKYNAVIAEEGELQKEIQETDLLLIYKQYFHPNDVIL